MGLYYDYGSDILDISGTDHLVLSTSRIRLRTCTLPPRLPTMRLLRYLLIYSHLRHHINRNAVDLNLNLIT